MNGFKLFYLYSKLNEKLFIYLFLYPAFWIQFYVPQIWYYILFMVKVAMQYIQFIPFI